MMKPLAAGFVLASALASSLIAQTQNPPKVDPMVQRLATCVDLLTAVSSGQLVDRMALVKTIKDAFEVANPGKTLGPDMKVIDKPKEREKP